MNESIENDTFTTMTSYLTTALTNTTTPSLNSATNSANYTFCGPAIQDFRMAYCQVHGYISLFVCLFGSVANTLNIAVLSRREMKSPTNAILTGLAVADLLVMLEYIPYVGHTYLIPNRPRLEKYAYGWSMYVLIHSIFTQVCHTISIWLTVTLAVWRYIAIAYPQRNREWCRMEITVATIVSAYIVCPIICFPLYISYTLKPSLETFTSLGNKYNNITYNSTVDGAIFNATIYFVSMSEMASNGSFLRDLDFWVYSVVIKIIPCIALTVLSTRLIMALLETKKRRQQLMTGSSAVPLTNLTENGELKPVKKKHKKNVRLLDKERQTDRTTRMLLAVLLLFLITEFPQGILGLLSVVLEKEFFYECYNNLGEVMDVLALINSAINFILYCAMSRQFRTSFRTVVCGENCCWSRAGWLKVGGAGGNAHGRGRGDNNGHTTATGAPTQVTQV